MNTTPTDPAKANSPASPSISPENLDKSTSHNNSPKTTHSAVPSANYTTRFVSNDRGSFSASPSISPKNPNNSTSPNNSPKTSNTTVPAANYATGFVSNDMII